MLRFTGCILKKNRRKPFSGSFRLSHFLLIFFYDQYRTALIGV